MLDLLLEEAMIGREAGEEHEPGTLCVVALGIEARGVRTRGVVELCIGALVNEVYDGAACGFKRLLLHGDS